MLSKKMRILVGLEIAFDLIGKCYGTVRQLWDSERPSHYLGLPTDQNLPSADACPCLKRVELGPSM